MARASDAPLRDARDPHGTRSTAAYVLAGALVVVVFVAPLVWAVLRSFQPAAVITAAPSWSAVTELSWDNYRGLFRDVGISRYVVNSLIVSSTYGICSCGSSSPSFSTSARDVIG